MSAAALLLRQVRYANKAFWRNPAAAFFTFVFPLMFLVIFTAVIGGGRSRVSGVSIDEHRYFLVAMMSFAVITACYTNLAMSVTAQREAGILKRVRGTPLPAWVYLTGRVVFSTLVALLLVIIAGAFGFIVYGTTGPTGTSLVEFAATLVVGAAAFAAIALATTAAIPNEDAAPAVVNGLIFPILFLSGIFFPIGDDAPAWISTIGRMFPVRHFADAMRASFFGAPFKFAWSDVVVVAAWGVAALLVAARFFSWEPRR
jgi:ABC-2 type transport system permease protein